MARVSSKIEAPADFEIGAQPDGLFGENPSSFLKTKTETADKPPRQVPPRKDLARSVNLVKVVSS
jgi:hypothetical protein